MSSYLCFQVDMNMIVLLECVNVPPYSISGTKLLQFSQFYSLSANVFLRNVCRAMQSYASDGHNPETIFHTCYRGDVTTKVLSLEYFQVFYSISIFCMLLFLKARHLLQSTQPYKCDTISFTSILYAFPNTIPACSHQLSFAG